MEDNKTYDCSRACTVERTEDNELLINYSLGCSKLAAYNWLEGINSESCKDLFEVRFKNTHKGIYRNTSGMILKIGDIVVVEAAYGHDVGIVTLEGPIVARQMVRHHIDPATYEFKKIYRKAKILDIERWQEAIAREHKTMIRSRQIAEKLGLSMKIGDVEFQGDGTKAIFYYIADERVDFRQLIKDFAAEFGIRIEMKQIGARQEAGLIGGIGVCGPLPGAVPQPSEAGRTVQQAQMLHQLRGFHISRRPQQIPHRQGSPRVQRRQRMACQDRYPRRHNVVLIRKEQPDQHLLPEYRTGPQGPGHQPQGRQARFPAKHQFRR